jgi:hypothetical protein
VSQDDQPETPTVNAAAINRKGKGKSVTFENPSKVTKQHLEREKRYANLNRNLSRARLESGTVVEEVSDEEPHVTIEDDQADDEMGDADPPTPPKVKPIRRERYVDRYIALTRK